MESDVNELYRTLPAELRRVLSAFERRQAVAAGFRLLCHNHAPRALTIIYSGRVELALPAAWQSTHLAVVREGKVLGLHSVISGEPPEVEATALEPCQIAKIPAECFLEVLRRNPRMYSGIARVLGDDLRLAEQHLRSVHPEGPFIQSRQFMA
jgi:CRP-like cAMP-binding protein